MIELNNWCGLGGGTHQKITEGMDNGEKNYEEIRDANPIYEIVCASLLKEWCVLCVWNGLT